jgi:hypothetical protein
MQDMEQGQHMLPLAAKLGLPNIVNYHVPNLFASVVLGQKILGERRCGDFGEVFVLGNGEHLLFGQAAESDAILERNHVRARLLIEPSRCGHSNEPQTISGLGINAAPVAYEVRTLMTFVFWRVTSPRT